MKKFRLLGLLSVMVLLVTSMAVQAQDRTVVRWYVGLGAGTDAPQVEAQQAVVDAYNASQDEIEVVLEIVDNDQAFDVLNTQIAAGNPPDIVGPMGIRGRASFPNAWLDLTPYIEETNYDLSDFDEALVDFYNIEEEGQIGIPFAVFPSFILYNKALFDEAGIPYPPEEFGAPYVDWNGEEREWNIDTLSEVAKILTVDANGNDATMEEFDPENIVQFGYGNQFTDIRGRLALFGASNFVDDEGNAVISENWMEGLEWYQKAMWEDYFYPNGVYGGSDILNAGNWFESGNIGMISIHLWYLTCCMFGLEDDFGIAAVPSYEGTITAKMHGDTFSILKNSSNPEAAFEVLTHLVGEAAPELTLIYGGMPARLSQQDAFFETLDSQEPLDDQDINWQVVIDAMAYPDSPSHEEAMPAFLESTDRYTAFTQLLDNDPEFDLEAGVEEFLNDLQTIFDSASN